MAVPVPVLTTAPAMDTPVLAAEATLPVMVMLLSVVMLAGKSTPVEPDDDEVDPLSVTDPAVVAPVTLPMPLPSRLMPTPAPEVAVFCPSIETLAPLLKFTPPAVTVSTPFCPEPLVVPVSVSALFSLTVTAPLVSIKAVWLLEVPLKVTSPLMMAPTLETPPSKLAAALVVFVASPQRVNASPLEAVRVSPADPNRACVPPLVLIPLTRLVPLEPVVVMVLLPLSKTPLAPFVVLPVASM